MSQFNARLTFLFLPFDAPYPSTEFIALEPMLIPRFAKLPANHFPVCALRNFLYIFLFFWSYLASVYLPEQTLFSFVFRLFLGPIVLVLNTHMFPSKFFLLILSYLATKEPLQLHATNCLKKDVFELNCQYHIFFSLVKLYISVKFVSLTDFVIFEAISTL